MNDVEMDYDNFYFNKTIELIKPETLNIYLDILFNFMKSDNIKICFPEMMGPLKVIFVEIVEDIRVLTSRCIDEGCKPLCKQIIDVLEANRNAYKLFCEQQHTESGLVLKKKIFIKTIPGGSDLNGHGPYALNMEDLNRKLDRLNNQSSITTGFKLQCLNTSLKFIKDDTQQNMKFTDLSAPQAELIHTLICNPNVNSDIGFGFKSFYAPLWEAMKIFGLKYEFKIKEMDTGNNKKCLVLEKIPKMVKKECNNNNIKPTAMDTSESDISFKSDASITTKKKHRKRDGILKNLSTKFLKVSLDKITEFYNDDAMASITFNNLNMDEHFFFFNFRNIMASNRMRSVFEKNIRIAFEKLITLAASKNNYKLCVKNVKMCDNRDKAISFSKIPQFERHSVLRVDKMDKKENISCNGSSDRSVSRESGNIKISVNGEPNSIKDDTNSSASGIKMKSVDSAVLNKTRALPSFTRHTLFINSVQKDRETVPMKGVNASGTPGNAQSNVKDDTVSHAETYFVGVNDPKEHKARDRNKESATLPLKNNASGTKSTNKSRNQSDQSTDRSVSKDRRAKSICFQPGGVLKPNGVLKHSDETIDTAKAIDKKENGLKERPRSGADLNNRKLRLLEAMSVPLKSDKAMQMMRGMGWEGGGLGLRGEGITEPIIPALERVSWAGLGHTPPPKPQKGKPRTPPEFRSGLLAAILQLVSSSGDLKVLPYQPILAKREKNFLQQIIQCYSTRSRIELADNEMVLSNQIIHLLKADPNMILRGCVSPCKSQIHLSKVVKNSHQPVNVHTGDLTIFHRMAKIEEKLKRVLQGDISNMMATLEQDCQTRKLYHLLEFKIEILIYLLEFLKAKELKMTWCSKNELNRKQIRYIDYALESIDLRARFGSTEPEIALVKEILRLSGDYQLEYSFFNQFKSFTVTKVNKPKNHANTHKNVVAKNNNTNDTINKNKISNKEADVVKSTDNVTSTKSDIELNSKSETTEEPVSSSSDDVIIIEGKESPIIISDDDDFNEDDLLQSPKPAPDSETERNVPDLELSEKCDNLDFDYDLRELEKAIKDADIKEEYSPHSKRSRTESPNSDIKISKISKLEIKKVHIVHSNYPVDRLNNVNIQNLQEVISCNILKSKDLPLLKCHGIQNGVLVYSCHNEQSYDWLKNTINAASDVTILETKDVIEDAYKMALQFNCYFEFDVDYLFEMLELYNEDLCTRKWIVLKHNIFMDHVSIIVKMDVSSYYYVRNSGYSLFAGVDEVQFSIIWD